MNLRSAVILLGFIAFITQVILLREFLTFFYGNELIIGIILATWMILTGLGAFLGRFIRISNNQNGIILSLIGSLAFIPVITVLGLHFLSPIFFTPGIMLGIAEAFYFTIIVLAPFCIVSGMLFTLLANAESVKTRSNQIGSVYAWESVGSLAGGVLLNFILIWFLSTFQSLYFIMALVVFITSFLAIRNKNYMIPGILIFVFLVFVFLFFTNDLDRSIREISYPSQTIEHIDETPYGIIVVTNNEGQINYYENNVLIASSGDVVLREESVHYAMVQHTKPENVLVLSGIISGTIPEILKYPVKSIDYVDVNPGVIRLAKTYFNADTSKKLRLIENDPIRYLRKTKTYYDVVLINLPKPSTIQFNRFYTVDFFELLKGKLNTNAVICISLPASANYMNEETRRLLSIITATIKTKFKNILILPGSEDFILASDNKLNGDISELIDRYGVKNEYVNSFYIHDELLMERSRNLMKQIDTSASKNLDFKPIAYQTSIKLWLSYFNFWYWLPAVIIMLISVFFFFRANALNKAVFAAGFSGTSIELMLLFVFQVLYGYVYFAAGVFIMIFMSGLAIGSLYWQKIFKQGSQKLLSQLLVSILIFSVTLAFIFRLFKLIALSEIIILLIFILLVLIISFLTGAVFSISTNLGKKEIHIIASEAYGLDLLGSAAGALLLSVYFVPILGFELSLIGTAFVCFISFLCVTNHSKKMNKC